MRPAWLRPPEADTLLLLRGHVLRWNLGLHRHARRSLSHTGWALPITSGAMPAWMPILRMAASAKPGTVASFSRKLIHLGSSVPYSVFRIPARRRAVTAVSVSIATMPAEQI